MYTPDDVVYDPAALIPEEAQRWHLQQPAGDALFHVTAYKSDDTRVTAARTVSLEHARQIRDELNDRHELRAENAGLKRDIIKLREERQQLRAWSDKAVALMRPLQIRHECAKRRQRLFDEWSQLGTR